MKDSGKKLFLIIGRIYEITHHQKELKMNSKLEEMVKIRTENCGKKQRISQTCFKT